MTCEPAIEEDFLKGYDCREGEMIENAGAAVFNTYRRSTIEMGDAKLAKPFLDQVKLLLPRKGSLFHKASD